MVMPGTRGPGLERPLKVRAPVRTSLLFASTFLFPAIGFPLITYAWWRLSRSWPFVTVVMGLPVVFGYLMPGIAVHVAMRWRFTSGPRIGSYYVHHGFVYGSKLAFVLLLVVRSLTEISSILHVVSAVLVTGAATAFGGWFHDVNAIRAGRIQVDGGTDALASFAPPTYFATGATYAGVALAAHRLLERDTTAIAWVFPAGLLVLCVVPTLVFLAVDPLSRHALRERLFRRRAGA
jgi:hypothetical protein